MNMHFTGFLSRGDPLYRYICSEILPQTGCSGETEFKVYRFSSSNKVYLYEDEASALRIIGKFFAKRGEGRQAAVRMEKEYQNLQLLRDYGFCGYPHYAARPLGMCASINYVLIEEYCYGTPLTEFLLGTIFRREGAALFKKLTALAFFLARLHIRTEKDSKVDFAGEHAYYKGVLNKLSRINLLGEQEQNELARTGERWRGKPCMWEDNQVLVHGDATPPNFLFGDGLWVMPIDLERMKYTDRVFDLGRVAGEIKHFFMQYARDKRPAEPFIGHFLWEYAGHFRERDSVFRAVTERLPFYMGLTELRIARNAWLRYNYRKELLAEAKSTLEFHV